MNEIVNKYLEVACVHHVDTANSVTNNSFSVENNQAKGRWVHSDYNEHLALTLEAQTYTDDEKRFPKGLF